MYENKARASVLPQMRQTFGVDIEQGKGVLPSLQSVEQTTTTATITRQG